MSRQKKISSKALASNKRRRRQWLTFMRMCRYGINNFSRNAWLTIAATAMMTLTLSVIMLTVLAQNVLSDSLVGVRDQVDMSLYVQSDTPEKEIRQIASDLKNIEGVTTVSYVMPEEAYEEFARQYKDSPQTLKALRVSDAKFPGVFRVNVVDLADTSALSEFVKENKLFVKYQDPNIPPSFEGNESKQVIDDIARMVSFVGKVGLAVSVVLIVISSLIVFNTIRMAIFNRKEEIEMMKLIGADRGFIRGPFIVEAVVYGFIAAVLATGLSILALYAAQPKLESYGVMVGNTLNSVITYIGFVLPAMILIGAVIGIISSLLATRKYLKI